MMDGLFEVKIKLPPEASGFDSIMVPDIRYFEVVANTRDEPIEIVAEKLTLPGTEAESFFYRHAVAKALRSNGVTEDYILHSFWA